MPLPPLAEQKRIVAKVEELIASVNVARDRLARGRAILKRFRRAILDAACSGRLTHEWRGSAADGAGADRLLTAILKERDNLATGARLRSPSTPDSAELEDLPDSWTAASVSQLAFLDVGFAFKSSEYSTAGVRLLRGENVAPGSLRWEDNRSWPSDRISGLEHLLVKEGEIILALDRPVISSGLKIARARPEDVPCLLVQRVMRFRMVRTELTPFLFLCLQQPRFVTHLAGGTTGSDLPHVTGSTVADFVVPLPTLEEQREIVRRVEALFALTDAIETRVAAATARAARLTQAVLAKAFRGELSDRAEA